MAVDRAELTRNLHRFYDFKDKSVLYVGAGGGQLLDPSAGARSVVAIDSDEGSLRHFQEESKTTWAGVRVEFSPHPFEEVVSKGDVVYFEFCLHEFENPDLALAHARTLSRDIVVMDHLPQSKWMYYAAEDADAARGLRAVEGAGVRRSETFKTIGSFDTYEQLADRLSGEGEVSRRRSLELKGKKDIRIDMDYGLFLL
jgi:2-polyprenyl-3-methyl-5-hydroxy-6-metoxy-1,4-benzoquinol methylase